MQVTIDTKDVLWWYIFRSTVYRWEHVLHEWKHMPETMGTYAGLIFRMKEMSPEFAVDIRIHPHQRRINILKINGGY